MEIIEAVNKRDIQRVSSLIDGGSDIINTIDYNGLTLLHLATRNNDVGMVSLLIEHGADIDSRNTYRLTPLHITAINGFDEITYILIKNGADVNIKNRRGDNALDIVLTNYYDDISYMKDRYFRIIRMLLPLTVRTLQEINQYINKYPNDENLLLYKTYLEDPSKIVERLSSNFDISKDNRRTIQTMMFIYQLRDDLSISKIPYELLFEIMGYTLS